jgi:hypothetical protein
MGRGRCRFALLACLVLAGAGLHPAYASASGEDQGSTQTSSNGASATAQNVSNTSQSSTEIQTGSGGGQSQTVTQSAPTDQTATAVATSQQSPTSGGSSDQSNQASSSNTATNVADTKQQSTQSQESSASQPNEGQSQSAEQSAPTKQDANASATSTQVAPANVNVVIRIDSPGNDGPVTQTNSSQASADAGNASSLSQGSTQAQNGAGSQEGQSQSSSQNASATQSAHATASSIQTDPLNANIVVRNKSPGDGGAVTQANTVGSTAGAANSNAVTQVSNQSQDGTGPAGGQSQAASQSAPVVQAADATATSIQAAPTNVSVTIDPAVVDPNGSGAVGTLIQIWIPNQPDTSAPSSSSAAGEAAQVNGSNATASAGNVNDVTQSAVQQQDIGGEQSSSPTQLGGGSQSQVLEQSAPTAQSANAEATSIQAATNAGMLQPGTQTSISSAFAQATNVSEVSQAATQIQNGGNGTQVQAIDQESPTTQQANVKSSSQEATAGSGSSLQTKAQAGANRGSPTVRAGSHRSGKSRAFFLWASPGTPEAVGRVLPSSGWVATSSARSDRGRRHVRDAGRRAPHEPRDPAPQDSAALGAPGNGAAGVSLWAFAALLVPFLLTAPRWARRHRSATFRRLLSVVLRLERPG